MLPKGTRVRDILGTKVGTITTVFEPGHPQEDKYMVTWDDQSTTFYETDPMVFTNSLRVGESVLYVSGSTAFFNPDRVGQVGIVARLLPKNPTAVIVKWPDGSFSTPSMNHIVRAEHPKTREENGQAVRAEVRKGLVELYEKMGRSTDTSVHNKNHRLIEYAILGLIARLTEDGAIIYSAGQVSGARKRGLEAVSYWTSKDEPKQACVVCNDTKNVQNYYKTASEQFMPLSVSPCPSCKPPSCKPPLF
jgi:hypothetical protein